MPGSVWRHARALESVAGPSFSLRSASSASAAVAQPERYNAYDTPHRSRPPAHGYPPRPPSTLQRRHEAPITINNLPIAPLRPSFHSQHSIPPSDQRAVTLLSHLVCGTVDKHQLRQSIAYSNKIWVTYNSLTTATRKKLPAELLTRIYRLVVPNWESCRHMCIAAHASKDTWVLEKAEISTRQQLAKSVRSWENRLRTVISDMSAPEEDDYLFAMEILAMDGNIRACESIIKELRELRPNRPLSIKIQDQRMLALMRWFKIRLHRTRVPAHEITRNIRLFLGVLREVREGPSEYRALTMSYAIRTALYAWRMANLEAKPVLEDLIDDLLRRGYGVDLVNLTVDASLGLPAVNFEVVNSVLDYLGRKGELFKMVAVFELLTNDKTIFGAENAAEENVAEDEEGQGETLAEATARENLNRGSLGIFGNGTSTFSDYFSPSSSASSSSAEPIPQETRFFSSFLPSIPSPLSLSSALQPSPAERESMLCPKFNTTTFRIMAAHSATNLDLAMHVVNLGLREALTVRSEWLAAYLGSSEAERKTIVSPAISVQPALFWGAITASKRNSGKGLHRLLEMIKEGLEFVDQELTVVKRLRNAEKEKEEKAEGSQKAGKKENETRGGPTIYNMRAFHFRAYLRDLEDSKRALRTLRDDMPIARQSGRAVESAEEAERGEAE